MCYSVCCGWVFLLLLLVLVLLLLLLRLLLLRLLLLLLLLRPRLLPMLPVATNAHTAAHHDVVLTVLWGPAAESVRQPCTIDG
jgi:hypothetical protein